MSEVDDHEVDHVHRVRKVLEVAALRSSMEHYTPHDIDVLRLVHREMEIADSASTNYYNLTFRFHQQLAAPCPNPLLRKLVSDVWELPEHVKVTGLYCARHEGIPVMLRDHAEIIDDIASGDVERAVDSLSRHLINVNPPGLGSNGNGASN